MASPRRAPNLTVNTLEQDNPAVQAAVNRVAPKGAHTLDRSRRDWGEITGAPFVVGKDPTTGDDLVAHYTQPDRYGIVRYFDGEGIRLKRDGEPPDGTRPPPPKGQKLRQVPVDRMQQRQVEEIQEEDRQPGDALVVGDVNLTAWMLRQEKYPFAMVRKAVEQRFSRNCGSEADIFDFLLQQGVVTAEQLRTAGVALSNDP